MQERDLLRSRQSPVSKRSPRPYRPIVASSRATARNLEADRKESPRFFRGALGPQTCGRPPQSKSKQSRPRAKKEHVQPEPSPGVTSQMVAPILLLIASL